MRARTSKVRLESTPSVTLRPPKGIAVYLDASELSAGAASRDTFCQVEYVYGSNFNYRLLGTDKANFLYGNKGNYVLSSGDGADRRGGYKGNDELTGRDRDDTSKFYGTVNEGVNQITDFTNDLGNNDVIALFTGGLFADLSPGSLAPSQFRSRNDNVAQDADDRFIFNKTDKKLWFDANGNLESGLTQILRLTDATNLTFADIVIL